MEQCNDIVKSGIKTFFIMPELSIIPEDFLKLFFYNGFESYYLFDDMYLGLESKLDCIYSEFPELILFFNIDRKLKNTEWPDFIAYLKNKYKEKATCGVIYSRYLNVHNQLDLEKKYLYDLELYCGCIPLEHEKKEKPFKAYRGFGGEPGQWQTKNP